MGKSGKSGEDHGVLNVGFPLIIASGEKSLNNNNVTSNMIRRIIPGPGSGLKIPQLSSDMLKLITVLTKCKKCIPIETFQSLLPLQRNHVAYPS